MYTFVYMGFVQYLTYNKEIYCIYPLKSRCKCKFRCSALCRVTYLTKETNSLTLP